jgi:hypothetical protein
MQELDSGVLAGPRQVAPVAHSFQRIGLLMTEPVVLGHVQQLVLTWRAQHLASVLQRSATPACCMPWQVMVECSRVFMQQRGTCVVRMLWQRSVCAICLVYSMEGSCRCSDCTVCMLRACLASFTRSCSQHSWHLVWAGGWLQQPVDYSYFHLWRSDAWRPSGNATDCAGLRDRRSRAVCCMLAQSKSIAIADTRS